MKKKFSPELLKEEQNRFKRLLEYDFYQEKKEEPKFKEIILGNELEEADDEFNKIPDDSTGAGADANAVADKLGVSDVPSPEGTPTPDASQEAPAEEPAEMSDEEPAEEPAPAEPASDDVEVDVTSLVKGSEEAKQAADAATQNTEALLQKFSELEARISNMTALTDKIEGLEKEMIKRNPTPVEKLEMRSLDSAPFTQKLSDYWSDKEGMYDVMGKNQKPKEYVLKKDDVDYNYSDADIKKSFSAVDSDYDEEEIDGYDEEQV